MLRLWRIFEKKKNLFEKESVIAVIHAVGEVEFRDTDHSLFASGKIIKQEGGREVYGDVCCKVEGSTVILQFPIYRWIE